MPKLGVNIDHVATLREARGVNYPDPIKAAQICEQTGVDSIVAHLREDRRHIQDNDIFILRKKIKTRLNLEMSTNKEIVGVACRVIPDQITLVPERRNELTTEGGLDVLSNEKKIEKTIAIFKKRNIRVSLFIDPEIKQIDAAKRLNCDAIELHTGHYAESKTVAERKMQLKQIRHATDYALKIGLTVNAGHGLNYENVSNIAKIPGIEELNIGHSIISYSIFLGLEKAVKHMLKLIKGSG
jgi:pyridoxine 5-phosphate synthase